jgi:hypothetical protein
MLPLRGWVEEVMDIGYIVPFLWMPFIGSAKPIKD